MGFHITTYGGLTILEKIFQSIAMLTKNSSGSLLPPMIMIGMGVGFFWAVTRAFFTSNIEHVLGKYFFPVLIMTFVLFLPTASVHIVDVTKVGQDAQLGKYAKVDNVPYILAFFAQSISSLGYKLTTALEKAMHVPNDLSYNQTGQLFGAETSLEASQYVITNADLAKNMRKFVNQCVVYDLQMGRYNLEDLQKTNNIYHFLENHTSKVLGMNFIPINKGKNDITESDTKLKNNSFFCSCKRSLEEMHPFFINERDYYLKHSILKNLPITFKALTNLHKDSENLIGQQLMIQALSESDHPVANFAKTRASVQQRETYHLVGSLAAKSLVVLRNVFEALIYVSFIFIIPMLFLPMGFKLLNTWVQMVLWIQLWPPFYAVLNYIMQIIAQNRAGNIIMGHDGLNIFTSVGIENLHADMLALAGYLSASIPFISYSLIKGGVSSFVHLATSMMTPAHSAASSAAIEKITGNYSYANASYGNMNYGNSSLLQRNLAPSFSGGYHSESSLDGTSVYGGSEAYFQQRSSGLRTSMFSDETIQDSLQQSKQESQSLVNTNQSLRLEGLQEHARSLSAVSHHVAQNANYSKVLSQSGEYSMQDSSRYFENLSEEFSNQHGLSKSSTTDFFYKMGANASLGLKIPLTEIGANLHTEGGHSHHWSKSFNESANEMNKVAQGEEFQKHFQNMERFSQAKNYNITDDEGNRLAQEHSNSKEKLFTYQSSYLDALSSLDQISKTESYVKTNSAAIKSNLTHDFIGWASEKYQNEGGFEKVKSILSKNEMDLGKRELFQEFNAEIMPARLKNLYQPSSLNTKYEKNSGWIKEIIGHKENPQTPNNIASILDLEHGTVERKGRKIKDSISSNIGTVTQNQKNTSDDVHSKNKNMKKTIHKKIK